MFRLLKPRHLRYRSIEEWTEREHIKSFVHADNPAHQQRLFQQFNALRTQLWEQHVVHLTSEERYQLETGQHPSQSHARIEQARPIFEEFRYRVVGLPYVADVIMGMYHMDRIVFNVKLASDIGWRTWQKDIAPFYRGFEVMVGVWKDSTGQGRPEQHFR
jgi:hypothetical protein